LGGVIYALAASERLLTRKYGSHRGGVKDPHNNGAWPPEYFCASSLYYINVTGDSYVILEEGIFLKKLRTEIGIEHGTY